MWIDRLEQRLNAAIDNLQHPGYLLAAACAVAAGLLLVFAFVVAGQVDRGQLRSQQEASLRSELWLCNSEANAVVADRCRQVARGETPASTLARWDDIVSVPPGGGIIPVSLNR